MSRLPSDFSQQFAYGDEKGESSSSASRKSRKRKASTDHPDDGYRPVPKYQASQQGQLGISIVHLLEGMTRESLMAIINRIYQKDPSAVIEAVGSTTEPLMTYTLQNNNKNNNNQ